MIIYKVYKSYGDQILNEKYYQNIGGALAYVQGVFFANPNLSFKEINLTDKTKRVWVCDSSGSPDIVIEEIKVS